MIYTKAKRKRGPSARARIGLAANAALEKLLVDPEFTAHPADLSMLACIVWFDEISERVNSSPTVYRFVRPLIYARTTPLFDRERVCSWLIERFGYSQGFASQRVADRESYREPKEQNPNG